MSDLKPIGYNIVVARELAKGSSVSIQFNLPVGAPVADWNGELDKLIGVLDRQTARASLEDKYNELKHHELTAEVITQDIERMAATVAKAADARDPQRRNQVNTQQLENNITSQKAALEKTQRMVEEVKKIIAETEKKAA